MAALPGSRLGPYEIGEPLGAGGMGESPGSWADEAGPGRWVTTMEQRFPALRGRVDAMKVPADRATFRDPLTGADIKKRIRSMMRLDH